MAPLKQPALMVQSINFLLERALGARLFYFYIFIFLQCNSTRDGLPGKFTCCVPLISPQRTGLFFSLPFSTWTKIGFWSYSCERPGHGREVSSDIVCWFVSVGTERDRKKKKIEQKDGLCFLPRISFKSSPLSQSASALWWVWTISLWLTFPSKGWDLPSPFSL